MLSNYSVSVDLRHTEMWVQSCYIIQFSREDGNLDIFETFLHFSNLLTLEFLSFFLFTHSFATLFRLMSFNHLLSMASKFMSAAQTTFLNSDLHIHHL